MFSLPANWIQVVRPAYAKALRFPASFSVPTRTRAIAQQRLQLSELWGLGGIAEDKERLNVQQSHSTEYSEQVRLQKQARRAEIKAEFEKQTVRSLNYYPIYVADLILNCYNRSYRLRVLSSLCSRRSWAIAITFTIG